jgi:general stress protein 26
MPTDTKTDTVAEQHLWPLIKGIKFAMFTTQHGNGHLHSRPMTTQNKTMLDDCRLPLK